MKKLDKNNYEDFKHAGLSDLEIERFTYVLEQADYYCDYDNNRVMLDIFDIHSIIQNELRLKKGLGET